MSSAIEELASAGVHDKVFEIVTQLPGTDVFDAPAGYGALTDKLLGLGRGNYSDLYRLILSDEICYGETIIIVAQKIVIPT